MIATRRLSAIDLQSLVACLRFAAADSPPRRHFLACLLIMAIGTAVLACSSARAQESNLADRQASVADRYQRLEELLLRLADVEAAENPERAALLRRAARQSRDQFVLTKIKSASEALRAQQFQEAVENQGAASEGLENILKLLLSEDRSKRIRDEKERIAQMIKDLKRIERAQRSTRARAENGADLDDVRDEQESIGDRSEELKAQLSEANQSGDESQSPDTDSPSQPSDDGPGKEASENEDADQKSGSEPKDASESDTEPKATDDAQQSADGQPGSSQRESDENQSGETESQTKPSDAESSKPSESQPSESQPSESQPSESQPSESQPSESQPSESQPSESQPSESQPQQPQSPERQAEDQLQRAIEKMRQAEKELEQAKRDQATEKQREAEENLRAAIDRLEKILRQLREEEMQRELARLEARFRKMAEMQSKVLDDTVALSATPKSQRNRQTDLKSGELAFEEKKITLEADRAMLLLREEGSSVAFPEVVSQLRDETVRVADRLSQSQIDAVTQGIQQDILAALEEMIAALQKAQRDLEKQRQDQQQQPPSQSGPGEQPLVQALAELKLIRTMETRVKTTTERYSDLLQSGETSGEEVLPLLQNLSERQNRLYQITRDLVLKRNQ